MAAQAQLPPYLASCHPVDLAGQAPKLQAGNVDRGGAPCGGGRQHHCVWLWVEASIELFVELGIGAGKTWWGVVYGGGLTSAQQAMQLVGPKS